MAAASPAGKLVSPESADQGQNDLDATKQDDATHGCADYDHEAELPVVVASDVNGHRRANSGHGTAPLHEAGWMLN